ncbi:hypothetical protein DRO97_04095 [Archaeoglobales archaeon]|nr:MAG: hypothetical protein DRO97_04095 [Archaeoglobales archaeon]
MLRKKLNTIAFILLFVSILIPAVIVNGEPIRLADFYLWGEYRTSVVKDLFYKFETTRYAITIILVALPIALYFSAISVNQASGQEILASLLSFLIFACLAIMIKFISDFYTVQVSAGVISIFLASVLHFMCVTIYK